MTLMSFFFQGYPLNFRMLEFLGVVCAVRPPV